jgi:hypothetical protein
MLKKPAILAFAVLCAGCAKDDYQRIDGMTYGAGNAIAANTVMQMVDPWPVGVDDTNLSVPADRSAFEGSNAGEVKAPGAGGKSAGSND